MNAGAGLGGQVHQTILVWSGRRSSSFIFVDRNQTCHTTLGLSWSCCWLYFRSLGIDRWMGFEMEIASDY